MSWTLDPHHTSVAFSAKHLGVATVRGVFAKADAEVELDNPEDPTTAKGRVTIDASSITTHNEQRDGHLRAADFLDVEKYPTITFTLKGVERRGDDYEVVGDLTIKDVTKPVTLKVEYQGVHTTPWNTKVAAFSATAEVNREDWGLTWNAALEGGGVLVSKKVQLEIEAQVKVG